MFRTHQIQNMHVDLRMKVKVNWQLSSDIIEGLATLKER